MADELDRAVAAFRASEPRRTRDPFADPGLRAALGAGQRRAGSRWMRLSPAPLFAGAALALLLAVAPPAPAEFRTAAPMAAAALPGDDGGGQDGSLLLAVAAALAVAGAVQHRRTRA